MLLKGRVSGHRQITLTVKEVAYRTNLRLALGPTMKRTSGFQVSSRVIESWTYSFSLFIEKHT